MNNAIQIFQNLSGGYNVYKHKKEDKSTVYFTLAVNGANTRGTQELSNILMGRAPAIKMTMQEAVDYDMHKALNGAYMVASFGYAPVNIVLTGIDLWLPNAECATKLGSGSGVSDIKGWWDSFNLQADPEARARINIYRSGGNTTYDCITTKLNREVVANDPNGIGTYRLELIGIRTSV